MYHLGTQREFIARHFLIGGDFGAENFEHSHAYRLEIFLTGPSLDRHGYLIDLIDLERAVDEVVALYRERLLNETPAFSGLNPSIEHFSRILHEALMARLEVPSLTLRVKLWENGRDWAGYGSD